MGPENDELSESVQKGTNLILAKAATCGHLLWRPLGGHLRPLAATCSGGHLRPLAATCSGGHLRPLAATCPGGHLRPLDWLQVAASGCQAWVKLYFSPFILSWAENIGNFPLPAHGKFITFSVGTVLAM